MKKNVLMVLNRYHPMIGGAENQCRILMNQLKKSKGINIFGVATHRYSETISKRDDLDGIDIYRLGLPGVHKLATLSFYASLFLFLYRNKNKIDIIHVHTISITSFICVLFSTLFGKKTLQKLTIAGEIQYLMSREGIKGFILKTLIKFSISKGNTVVLTDEGLKEVQIYNHKQNYFKISNGIDKEIFYKKNDVILLRDKFKFKKGEIYLGFVGRLTDVKGILEISKAVLDYNKIEDKRNNIYLAIMGSGQFQVGSVQLEIEKLVNDSEYISLHNPEHQPIDFYNAIDFYLSNSKKEGLPNTVLEALSCGKKMILSAIPSHVEIKENNSNSPCIRTFDNIEMFFNILNDVNFMDVSNQEVVIDSRFFIENVAVQYERLYKSL